MDTEEDKILSFPSVMTILVPLGVCIKAAYFSIHKIGLHKYCTFRISDNQTYYQNVSEGAQRTGHGTAVQVLQMSEGGKLNNPEFGTNGVEDLGEFAHPN